MNVSEKNLLLLKRNKKDFVQGQIVVKKMDSEERTCLREGENNSFCLSSVFWGLKGKTINGQCWDNLFDQLQQKILDKIPILM